MSTENGVKAGPGRPEFALGIAVAEAVAKHTDLIADHIAAVHIDADHCTIRYIVRSGLSNDPIRVRLRTIDPTTGHTIRDQEA